MLDCRGCGLDPGALGRVFDALSLNSHLTALHCDKQVSNLSSRFARSRVLPAVLACASLRTLNWDDMGPTCGAVAKSVEEVLEGRQEEAAAPPPAQRLLRVGVGAGSGGGRGV